MNNICKKIVVLSFFVICAVMLTGGAALAAEAKLTPDVIGVIDSQRIVSQHPSFEQTRTQLRDIMTQKENETKTAMDKEPDQTKKRQIFETKQDEVRREERRLMEPIFKDCEEAVRVVAKQRSVTIVLEKASVYFGGHDITDYVVQQLARGK